MKIGNLRHKFIQLSRFLENPKLISLYRRNINLDIYESLDKNWLSELRLKTILDIGANSGYFALAMNALRPEVKIYSFEPLPECFEELKSKTKNIPNIQAFNIALGNQSGSLTFRRNAHNLSSSFLEMTNLHTTAFPDTTQSENTEVSIERLDDFVKNLTLNNPLMVKLDVQGFEDQVLMGGMNTITQASVIITETSFYPLYKNQPLFNDIYQILKSCNYIYAGALESLYDPSTGRILQEDSIFIRET
jgi:FkbM family methyltransferase